MVLGYAPNSSRSEYFSVAQLASRLDVPVFTHARFVSDVEPDGSLEGALEIIAAAAGTGALMHLCHVTSTSLRQTDVILEAIASAQRRGNRVTTEVYPYLASCTPLSASFLEPSQLYRMGLTPSSLVHVATRERIGSMERLAELRRTDPSGWCVVENFRPDDPSDTSYLFHALTFGDAAIASDALPLMHADPQVDPRNGWPPPTWFFRSSSERRDLRAHPRLVVRELGLLSLPEAIRRCTLVPATILQTASASMGRKGRIQVGADADIVIFDAATVIDRATFESIEPSTGFSDVMVNGEFVVRDGSLLLGATPGRAVRSDARFATMEAR